MHYRLLLLPSLLLIACLAISPTLSAQNEIPTVTLHPEAPPIIFAGSKHEFSTIYELKQDERADSVRIYDRWGNLVHESSEQACLWNGFDLKEKQCEEGLYTFVLEISNADGTRYRLLSIVTLLHDYRECG